MHKAKSIFMYADTAGIRNESLEKMATIKNILKSTLFGFAGLPFISANAQVKTIEPTMKTPVQGESYFRYGIYQSQADVKPFLTCVTEKNCPQRTQKTLISKAAPRPLPLEVEKPMPAIRGVYFAFGSSQISQYEQKHLRTMAPALKAKNIVYLRAYTDPVGGVDSAGNRKLARNRATQVLNFLKRLGVKGEIKTEYNPPCCIKQGVTATSSDEERKSMRVVEIS